MRRAVNAAFFAVLLLAAAAKSPALAAAHDGNWSVLIIPEKGDCDRAYRYPLGVAGGQVRYTGEAGANVSGTVSSGGAVKVSIRMGDKGASGTGHLSGSAGTGTWRGSGGGAGCAGRWEAEKR
jgi:hypothetical protein